MIGCGSITDGTYKLEVHILNFNEDDYYEMEISKGDKIKIVGTMYATGKQYIVAELLETLNEDP